MSTAPRRHRHVLARCAPCASGALVAALLATSAWAATPIDNQSSAQSLVSISVQPATRGDALPSHPLLYAQVKSLWKGQQQPAQARPPAPQQQPQIDEDDEHEEGPPDGPPPSQNQPPNYGQQPGQPPGFPPGYPQQPAQMPPQPQPGQMQGPPPRYGQQPGQQPNYGQQPGQQTSQPPGYQQTQRPGQPPPAAAGGQFQYRGFHIDATAIAGSPQSNEVMAALARQVDAVVATGVRPEIAQFFQSQPIHVRPDVQGAGRFHPRDGGVAMAATPADADKPILLHYMLHAYQWHALPDGNRNQQINTFYGRARDGGMYPQNARALRSAPEFFAVTATGFLSTNERAARFRQSLQQRQPDYYQWLGQLFGVQR
jgi:hypothetical protein